MTSLFSFSHSAQTCDMTTKENVLNKRGDEER